MQVWNEIISNGAGNGTLDSMLDSDCVRPDVKVPLVADVTDPLSAYGYSQQRFHNEDMNDIELVNLLNDEPSADEYEQFESMNTVDSIKGQSNISPTSAPISNYSLEPSHAIMDEKYADQSDDGRAPNLYICI